MQNQSKIEKQDKNKESRKSADLELPRNNQEEHENSEKRKNGEQAQGNVVKSGATLDWKTHPDLTTFSFRRKCAQIWGHFGLQNPPRFDHIFF